MSTSEPTTVAKFDFDDEFQSKITALACFDTEFIKGVSHILKPEYFENDGEAVLVNLCLDHFLKYGEVPDKPSLVALIKEKTEKKLIRKELVPVVVEAFKRVNTIDLTNKKFVEDKVVEFVKMQAITSAILKSAELLHSGRQNEIEKVISDALSIGASEENTAYDYYEELENRTEIRIEKHLGIRPPQGITTGHRKLDDVLYHQGWGRKELACFVGGPKSGKTAMLIGFAHTASQKGFNVLYVTLEVSAKIISDRLDALISETAMKELGAKAKSVKEKVYTSGLTSGHLIIHEFPSGSLTPNGLRKLIQSYKKKGLNKDGSERPPINFDLIVVDYADLMIPNYRTQNVIENSRTIYVDLRAIAHEENGAMLTATQSNREGAKSVVIKAENVAEDYNKVRTVDLLVSINKTEEEASRGEARLYFAASRNQESGFSLVIKQNMSTMKAIESVVRVE